MRKGRNGAGGDNQGKLKNAAGKQGRIALPEKKKNNTPRERRKKTALRSCQKPSEIVNRENKSSASGKTEARG